MGDSLLPVDKEEALLSAATGDAYACLTMAEKEGGCVAAGGALA